MFDLHFMCLKPFRFKCPVWYEALLETNSNPVGREKLGLKVREEGAG